MENKQGQRPKAPKNITHFRAIEVRSALGPWEKLLDKAGAVGRDPIVKLFVLLLLSVLSALLSSSFIKQ